MLWFSLVMSAVVLFVSYFKGGRAATVGFGVGLSIAPALVGCLLPCVAIQTLLILLLFGICAYRGESHRTSCCMTTVATVLVYIVYGAVVSYRWPEFRQTYPYESLEARLPKTSSAADRSTVLADGAELLETESEVYRADRLAYFGGSPRAHHLYLLHESKVGAFAESFGFGAGRLTQLGSPITEASLARNLRAESPVRQPGSRSLELLSEASASHLKPVHSLTKLNLLPLHRNSFIDFAYPAGFGYFKDRAHVAGFRPHQFSQVPDGDPDWKVETLDLVGLVVHEQPVAYVSELLPRMEELRAAPTRPLDVFEEQGLAELRGGSPLFLRQQGERLRMLGPIHAAKQCTSCHGCERGELLGAFSYVLHRSSH